MSSDLLLSAARNVHDLDGEGSTSTVLTLKSAAGQVDRVQVPMEALKTEQSLVELLTRLLVRLGRAARASTNFVFMAQGRRIGRDGNRSLSRRELDPHVSYVAMPRFGARGFDAAAQADEDGFFSAGACACAFRNVVLCGHADHAELLREKQFVALLYRQMKVETVSERYRILCSI